MIRCALCVSFFSVLCSASNAAELDQMFNSLPPAYTTMEGAKACKLELEIGPDVLAFAAERVAKLEQTSKLSADQRTALRDKAIKEAPMLVAIGACQSVLAAFEILDLQRKVLKAQQPKESPKRDEPERPSPSPRFEPRATDVAPPQANLATPDETQLPIAPGAYVRSKEFCENLRKGELDLIDFELEENLRTFSTGENSCVVSKLKKISPSRTKVDADCMEFGEGSQLTFMLDRLPNGNIRVNGDDQLHCPINKNRSASKASIQDFIGQWSRLNVDCRGGSGDDPHTTEQCDKRDDLSLQLEALGYCYKGGTTAASNWKRCD